MLFARVGGILVVLFGLYQLGVFGSSKVLGSEHRFPIRLEKMTMSPITAFIMGFAFSFAWTPCVGPAFDKRSPYGWKCRVGSERFSFDRSVYDRIYFAVFIGRHFYCTAFRSFQKAYEDRPLYSENRRSTHGADGTAYVYRENE